VEIIVLGSGSNGGIPQVDCMECETCLTAIREGIPNRRTRSSIAIKDKSKYVLIDATPDLAYQLIREGISTREISHILLTHAHGDHCLGLYEFSVGKKLRTSVMSAKEVLNEVFRMMPYLIEDEWLKAYPIKDKSSFKLGSLEVHPFKVPHRVKYSPFESEGGFALGYKIICEASLAYIPDIAEVTDEVLNQISGVDVLFTDGTFYEDSRFSHICIKKQIPILKELSIGSVYFTHINHTEPLHEVMERRLEAYGCHIAYDGMRILI